jgi:hypothetical protein
LDVQVAHVLGARFFFFFKKCTLYHAQGGTGADQTHKVNGIVFWITGLFSLARLPSPGGGPPVVDPKPLLPRTSPAATAALSTPSPLLSAEDCRRLRLSATLPARESFGDRATPRPPSNPLSPRANHTCTAARFSTSSASMLAPADGSKAAWRALLRTAYVLPDDEGDAPRDNPIDTVVYIRPDDERRLVTGAVVLSRPAGAVASAAARPGATMPSWPSLEVFIFNFWSFRPQAVGRCIIRVFLPCICTFRVAGGCNKSCYQENTLANGAEGRPTRAASAAAAVGRAPLTRRPLQLADGADERGEEPGAEGAAAAAPSEPPPPPLAAADPPVAAAASPGPPTDNNTGVALCGG